MDVNIKKSCPNCSQLYSITCLGPQLKGNIPLFLSCGHSMCETCVESIIKFSEPIECKVCHQSQETKTNDGTKLAKNKKEFYKIFPVNMFMLGELTAELMIQSDHAEDDAENYFVDLKTIIQNTDYTTEPTIKCNKCKVRTEKTLEYYCKDCKKSICMHCLMVGDEESCKNHDIASMQEVNEGFLEDLTELFPKVDETFRRLTKTAVDIGHLLNNIENETCSTSELTQIIASVEQHFSKLNAMVQKRKTEVTGIITKLKLSEKESLYKAKEDITQTIKKAKEVLNTLTLSLNQKKMKHLNLCVLLEDAKVVAESPWYLNKGDIKNENLNVAINEETCNRISDYILVHLEGNAKSGYTLRSTAELDEGTDIPAAPIVPVYPPELPKGEALRPKVPVMPFAESRVPKQLREDSQEIIYISHIVDPHNFYVQRACHQTVIKEMQREFKNSISSPKPSAMHFAEGKLYLAFNKTDNMWQRVRVLSVDRKNPDNPMCSVFCIDFGSTRTVPVDKLRLLQPGGVQSPPPLAINCCLANVKPKCGKWTSEDSLLIRNIINNKQAVIYIRKIRSSANLVMSLVCDVITFEDGVSLAHALAFHERARLVNPKLHYPKINGLREKPKLFMHNNNFKLKSTIEVNITHIYSPDKFYVRERHLQNVFDKLSEDLDQEYSIAINNNNIHLPEVGMVCVVNKETGWARALVLELPGRMRVRVLLVDTGAVHFVHWRALRPVRAMFTTQCALATECHLAGLTPTNKKWSAASVALLERFERRALELRVERVEHDRDRGSVGVTLYDSNDPDHVVCVNNEMIKYKFAITFGLFRFNVSDDENLVATHKSRLGGQQKSLSKRERKIKIKDKDEAKKMEANSDAKDKGPLGLEVKVLQYQSPSLLYVSMVHQQDTFNLLFEKIQAEYSKPNAEGIKKDWKEGDRCCAFCEVDKTWRRAVVVELQGDKAKLFYSDFALVEAVSLGSLRVLTPDFEQLRDAAIKCHLSGVMSVVGTEWPSLTKEFLKELLDAYERLFITKIGNFKDRSMPVELWVYHTTHGGAFQPDIYEWRCLNKRIVEQGLAIPVKSIERATVEGTAKDDGDEMLSFLNVNRSVREWLQPEPLPPPPGKELADAGARVGRRRALAGAASSAIISDWLPAAPLPANEFTAVPTYVDNYGVVFLHEVSQQETLEHIRKALDQRFKKPDPDAKYAKWTVGEPCVALYFSDNRFYRGRVLEVNKKTSSCLVQYVDYGNEEICSFVNMRKSIALHQIPIQAHKCILARIRPIGNQWEHTTLDYIYKSVVEKQCLVKVAGERVGDLFPIELKYDKLWINDHLADFEMVEYTDTGSKTVIRRFAPQVTYKEHGVEELKSDAGPEHIVEEKSDGARSRRPRRKNVPSTPRPSKTLIGICSSSKILNREGRSS